MLRLQRWFQLAWLLGASLLVYSNFIHRGPDQFALVAALWLLLALGTLLLFLHRPLGRLLSCLQSCLVLLIAWPWTIRSLVLAVPHAPLHQGNPLAIFEVVFYFALAILPASSLLLLCWINRRAPRGRREC